MWLTSQAIGSDMTRAFSTGVTASIRKTCTAGGSGANSLGPLWYSGFWRASPTVSELKCIEELFRGRHFDREVIILCVRWYAVNSHSSQGLTADRVLVNADTGIHPDLLDSQFGYVSISCASHDATLLTRPCYTTMRNLDPPMT
jgi:hypothetical protein